MDIINFNEITDMTTGIEPTLESYEHELLDRTSIITHNFHDFITEHPALERPGNERLKEQALNIGLMLGKFYQSISDLK